MRIPAACLAFGMICSFPINSYSRGDSAQAAADFLGTWQLVRSLDARVATISLPFKSPVGKVVVERLRGNKEIRRFPPKVQGIIRRNPMGRIRIIEFDTAGSVMDSAYIGATLHGDSLISVVSYSRKTKKFYDITKLTKDTMIVGNRDYYVKKRAKP